MRKSHQLLPSLLLALAVDGANAADVIVKIHNRAGDGIADAVVTLTGDGTATSAPAQPPAGKTIDQRDETFIPYVEIFRPGDRVVFRNSDHTRHHVYSFSPVKTFEFVLKPGEKSPPLTLDKTGIAAVGCNIHDHMISYLFVTDALRSAKSGADGVVRMEGLAAGLYTVHVWHPQLHPGHPEMTQPLSLATGDESRTLDFTLSLLPDPRVQMRNEYDE